MKRKPRQSRNVFSVLATVKSHSSKSLWGSGLSQNVVWYVVRICCQRAGLEHIAPHDLRRTCAKLCHDSGGELEQIQFLLGHASVQTTVTANSRSPHV